MAGAKNIKSVKKYGTKAARRLVLLLAVIFIGCMFSATAFASYNSIISEPSKPSSSVSSTSSAVSGSESSSDGSSSTSNSHAGNSSASTVKSTAGQTQTRSESDRSNNTNNNTDNEAPKPIVSLAPESQAESLASQDYSELLAGMSSAESQDGTVSAASAAAAKKPVQQNSGISWLMIVGIALVLLGIGGICYFIYAQFFSEEAIISRENAKARKNTNTRTSRKH